MKINTKQLNTMELIATIQIPIYIVNYIENGIEDNLTQEDINEVRKLFEQFEGCYFDILNDSPEFRLGSEYYEITQGNYYYQGAEYLTMNILK